MHFPGHSLGGGITATTVMPESDLVGLIERSALSVPVLLPAKERIVGFEGRLCSEYFLHSSIFFSFSCFREVISREFIKPIISLEKDSMQSNRTTSPKKRSERVN